MNPSDATVTISAFRATDHPELCERYIVGHRKVLDDFGVLQVIQPDRSWTRSPDCIVLMAEHSELGLVGGIRIQLREDGAALPMEKAIAPLDAGITDALDAFGGRRCGELCGLWNANHFGGYGLPVVLSQAAVSVAVQANYDVLFTFAAHYTLRLAIKCGFSIVEEIGEGGAVTYPLPRIKSFAMVLPDTALLAVAPTNHRQRMISLRCRPRQIRIESPSGAPYAVRYELLIERNASMRRIYSDIEVRQRLMRA